MTALKKPRKVALDSLTEELTETDNEMIESEDDTLSQDTNEKDQL